MTPTEAPAVSIVPPVAPRPSAVARAALLAYVFLIVYASWFPFSGWRNSGLSPLAFLNWEVPRYWTGFDVAVNVVGYVPLGVLLVFALPSNLDFVTNGAGCVVGTVLGALSARTYLERGRLYRLRARWFAPHASQGLVVAALWPLAQIYPQSYLFGHGQLLPIVSGWLSDWLDTSIDLVAMLRRDGALSPEQYWLSETIITACGLTGAVLCILCLMRRGAPRALLAGGLVGAALLVKSLASALLFTPDNAWVWVTPGAQGGFLIGAIMLAGLAFAPQVAQRRLAVLTLVLSLLVVNTIPVNPYFVNTLQAWVQGKFLNFNGAAQFLGLMWPFFALWYLLLPAHELNRQQERV